jgi:hypothetical protein
MRNCLAVFLLVVGIAIASAGLAGLFGLLAATVLDWRWDGVYFSSHDETFNGRKFPEAVPQTLFVALPTLVMLAGAGLIALEWRTHATCRASRNRMPHRS